MGVSIAEIMKLPSLQGARVVAGWQGMERTVSSISVSEYSRGDQFKDIHFDSFASEIVISAFFTVKDSVDAQCATLEGFHANKVAGLILFYVGVIIPFLDKRVIDLANRLRLPIIIMPEGRPDLRYGEVIYEVVEAVLKNRLVGHDFKNEIIKQISSNPEHQQTVGSVMRALSDKTHASLILADVVGEPINASVWPRNLVVENFLQNGRVVAEDGLVGLHDGDYHVYSCGISLSHGLVQRVMIYKRGEPLPPDVVLQVGETIEVAINLWGRGHGENLLSELVGAVLKDEPYKMRRIANTFDIDLDALQDMWIISATQADGGKGDRMIRKAPGLISEELAHLYDISVFDVYEGRIVVLMGEPRKGFDLTNAAQGFCNAMAECGIPVTVTVCRNLIGHAQLRKAYLLNRGALETARELYPLRTTFTYSEIKFADRCKKIVDSGEAGINQFTEILGIIPNAEGASYRDMLKTLSTYYLDARGDILSTAELLYLHRNTIRYRLRKFREYAPDGLETITEVDELYTALAIRRILDQGKKG